MRKNTFRFAAGIIAATTLIAPFAAGAVSLQDLQAQVRALMSQISQTQTLNTGVQAGVSTGVSSTSSVGSGQASNFRICGLLNRDIRRGMRGDDVSGLQEFLQSEGYFSGTATGYFGPMTARAVAMWQSSQGVSSVGAVGPITRARISMRCGNPTPTPNPTTCKPLNYMPIACSDGSAAQPTHNESGCLIGYECPVANYTPPASCKSWNDGCNACSRNSVDAPAMCTMRACFAAGKGYCSVYFDNPNANGNKPPVISGFSGPTTLAVGATGTWTINASDPENGTLSYNITWGDENTYIPMTGTSAMMRDAVQATTFTHAYANVGTYTVTIVVHDSVGKEAKTSSTVQVGNDNVICTAQYAPVCGQPPMPVCPQGYGCPMVMPLSKTYSNRCQMNAEKATFVHEGACTGTLNGTISVGPLCPVETNPPQPQCKPTVATFAAHRLFVYASGGSTLVSTITANIDGTYSAPLNSGDYKVKVENAGSCTSDGGGYNYRCSGMSNTTTLIPIHIYESGSAVLYVSIDTGIR